MKLTKKAQMMMDRLEEYFSEERIENPIAVLTYENRQVEITQEIYKYDYGGQDRKEGPLTEQAAEEHKRLKEFLSNIDPDKVEIEIIESEDDIIKEGFELIMSGKEDDDCFFENLC